MSKPISIFTRSYYRGTYAKRIAKLPTEVQEIRCSIYVDDILLSGETDDIMEDLKVITIFHKAGFTLHKWHSNMTELEFPAQHAEIERTEQSFAKQQLKVNGD